MRRTNSHYVTPLKQSDATEADPAPGTDANLTGRGVFTLLAGTTYIYVIDPALDATFLHGHLQGDAEIIITSATFEECDMAEAEVSNTSDNVSEWLATPAALIESTAEGTGWTATSDVGAAAGGNVGGVVWNIAHHGGHRVRVKLVVGATGGQARFALWAKE